MTTEAAATLDAIIQTAGDAIVVADSHGNIVRWNPAAERIFGHSADEVLGHSLTMVIPERFHAAHNAGMQRVVDTGVTKIIGHTVEIVGVHADGHEFPLELSLATWIVDGERFFTGIIRDTTERTELMHELSATRARMEAILRSANDAIISIDHQGLVLLWNQHAEKLFGWSEEEMLGQPLSRILPERHRQSHHDGVERVAGGGETHVIGHTVELTALDRDGREFPIELSLAMWEDEAGERSFSGIIRDITERKDAETKLHLANEALNEKNEQLEALSGKLAKYLSRQVYDSIFAGRTDVRVESYRKKLTVFFSDIQGFTELTDRMEAEPLSVLLNNYLSEMSDIAYAHGGTVDKFIGDGIMIFFGDPESRGDQEDALACARMALEMKRRIATMRNEWIRESGGVSVHVRMGINTGYCTVGNFGSEDRLDYTIVGKEVNAASRLENTAQPDQIHISNDTYQLIKDEIYCRPVGEVKVKGLAYPIHTYEVAGLMSERHHGPIVERAGGFSLDFDPSRLAPEEAEAARRALERALGALEGPRPD
jgi:PAS domain S-box-containing protein